MAARLFRFLFIALLCHAMLSARATGINISTRVENISYDLGFMQLSLENIGSSMRLSPTVEGSLLVEDIRAERLRITLVPDAPSAGTGNGLPERINLPLAIRVKNASVAEVTIIDGESRRTLNNVVFHLNADTGELQLELVGAATPWGQVHGTLSMQNARPYPLNGSLSLMRTDGGHPYDIRVDLAGDLQRLNFSSTALLQQTGGQLALLHPESTVAADVMMGKITIDGQLGLDGDMPLELHARFSDFSAVPDSQLNAGLHVRGRLSPQADLDMRLEAFDSRWHGAPVTLLADVRLLGQIMESISLDVGLRDNRLHADGSLGAPSSVLSWQLAFSDLSALSPTLGGHFSADGRLRGRFDQLLSDMQWLGEKLSKGDDLGIAHLTGQASFGLHDDAALSADLHATGLSIGQGAALDAVLKLGGTHRQHRIELDSTMTATGKPLLQALIAGGFDDSGIWSGKLEKLAYTGAHPTELQGKAGMRYDSTRGFMLDNLTMGIGGGRLQVDRLQLGNGRLTTRGSLDRVDLAALPEILPVLPANMTGNPVFSGKWDITADESANGRAELRLVDGDINILAGDGSMHPLGLDVVETRLELAQNLVHIDARANGSTLGSLNLSLATALEPTPTGFVLTRQAPLEIRADARLHSLTWLPLPTSMGVETDGRINLQLTGKGTIAQPGLQGMLQARQLRFSMLSGIDLRDGILDAVFRDDLLDIEQARFSSGDGHITATGSLGLRNGEPRLSLHWHAEDFTAISRTDGLLVIAGEFDTGLSGELMEISGAVEVMRGLIELGGEDRPVLGSDVVVIGVSEEEQTHPLRIQINDLRVSTGNDFVLRGRGLDSKLSGSVTLNGRVGGNLRAEGTIDTTGTYMAYGQVLNIERGRLVFNGQVDNPGLDILALRQNLAVRAGVEIRGTALNPAVKLVSVPEVSDSDKLAWLVFGHGMDRVGQDQFALLSLAAGALLSQGQSVPLQTRFARAAGLDSLSISGIDGENANASVSLGKRLTSNLYLSYEKEINGLLNVARLTYDLTSNWSIRTQAGSESAVDVLYTFSFK